MEHLAFNAHSVPTCAVYMPMAVHPVGGRLQPQHPGPDPSLLGPIREHLTFPGTLAHSAQGRRDSQGREPGTVQTHGQGDCGRGKISEAEEGESPQQETG